MFDQYNCVDPVINQKPDHECKECRGRFIDKYMHSENLCKKCYNKKNSKSGE